MSLIMNIPDLEFADDIVVSRDCPVTRHYSTGSLCMYVVKVGVEINTIKTRTSSGFANVAVQHLSINGWQIENVIIQIPWGHSC